MPPGLLLSNGVPNSVIVTDASAGVTEATRTITALPAITLKARRAYPAPLSLIAISPLLLGERC
jgi:hypothetical protein